jgi:predicted flap endonuclease-1-like 5' DNA nuclease
MRGVLYAAWEIVLLLLAAGVIGVLLGWVLTKWTIGLRANRAEQKADDQKAMAQALREQNDTLQRDLTLARSALHDQATELRRVQAGRAVTEMASLEATESIEQIAARTAGDEPRRDDDLQLIRGIGPKLEGLLKEAGITSFAQIARFDGPDIAVVAAALGSFPKRIQGDDWIGGAARLHEETYGEPV